MKKRIIEKINVAEEFSDAPGPRYIIEGDYSGEEFLNKLLLPRFQSAINQNGLLEIVLDGAMGYPSSFVDGSFGELARNYYTPQQLLDNIVFVALDEPYLVREFEEEYIKTARLKTTAQRSS